MASSSTILALLVAFSSVLALALGGQIKFTDCGSKEGTISSIDVSGCDALPCKLKKGTNVSIRIAFKTHKDLSTATSSAHGYIFGIPAPFPLPDSNSCHFMECPASAGSDVTYKHSIYVQPVYPSLNLKVKWELMSPSGTIVCFQMPASVVA